MGEGEVKIETPIYRKTFFIQNTVEDMARLYHNWMLKYPDAIEGFLLGPNEYLSFKYHAFEERGLVLEPMFKGLPVYMKRSPGIDAVINEKYATTLAQGDIQVEGLTMRDKVQ